MPQKSNKAFASKFEVQWPGARPGQRLRMAMPSGPIEADLEPPCAPLPRPVVLKRARLPSPAHGAWLTPRSGGRHGRPDFLPSSGTERSAPAPIGAAVQGAENRKPGTGGGPFRSRHGSSPTSMATGSAAGATAEASPGQGTRYDALVFGTWDGSAVEPERHVEGMDALANSRTPTPAS